jgi:hypothetical protein
MKKNRNAKRFIGQDTQRRDLITPEREHDPYKAKAKPSGPLVCGQCGAVYDAGRWRRGAAPPSAEKEMCPACHRINDKYPAGEVHVEGSFSRAHRAEILNLLHNAEAREAEEHPLSRIMAIEESEEALVVKTTDIHLPRVMGNALERAFKAQADFRYDQPGHFIRVTWRREE